MRGQKGFTLLETLIALTILAVIAVSIFFALNISIKATARVDHHTTAESLIRTSMEIIKRCGFDLTNIPPLYQDSVDHHNICDDIITIPDGYDVVVSAERLDPSDEESIQKVTVSVDYDDELVMTTDAYKVLR